MELMKVALITGITGQDGAYLSEFLLNKGYIVHGIKRRTSIINTSRIDHLYNNDSFHLHYGDMTDSQSLSHLIGEIHPSEIYNLAAQSHVQVSFEVPAYTLMTNALGTLYILEAIRQHKLTEWTKFYQASTSELFGKTLNLNDSQNEYTPFNPRSPYAISKLAAHWLTINYRESYNMFACCGILFNHESPIRGETFVTRKIVKGLLEIKHGRKDCLHLGNIYTSRDWGHAKDYVEAMWLMLQNKKPKDYVIATGKTFKVKTFIEMVAEKLGFSIKWFGIDNELEGKIHKLKKTKRDVPVFLKEGDTIIAIDEKYYRPSEVTYLKGDPSKAMKELGWKPKIQLSELIDEMIESEEHKLKLTWGCL